MTEIQDNNFMDIDDIDIMYRIKNILLELSLNKQNESYKHIFSSVNSYINKYCKHNLITDLIDIDPDRSKIISYCDKCWTTFK